jgi:hypothetical protein
MKQCGGGLQDYILVLLWLLTEERWLVAHLYLPRPDKFTLSIHGFMYPNDQNSAQLSHETVNDIIVGAAYPVKIEMNRSLRLYFKYFD